METYYQINKLAQQLGVKASDLLALSAQHDPFYVGSPTSLAMARWFEQLTVILIWSMRKGCMSGASATRPGTR